MDSTITRRKIRFFFSQYYLWIVIGLVVAILAAGYWFLIRDRLAQIKEIGVVDLNSRIAELQLKQNTLNRLEDLSKEYGAVTDEQLKRLQLVLPTASDIPQIILDLKRLVEGEQLVLYKLNSGGLTTPVPAPGTTINKLNLSLEISNPGSYNGVKNFLAELVQTAPLFELNSFSYQPAAERYTLNLTLYYQ